MTIHKPTPTAAIIALLALTVLILLCGCASHRQTATTILVQHDTVLVQPRELPVALPLSESTVTTEAQVDTAQPVTAEDSLYRATATITQDGRVRLTLQAKPDAIVRGSVTVTDTTRARATTLIRTEGNNREGKPPEATTASTTTGQRILNAMGWLFLIEVIVIILWFAAKANRKNE